MLNSIKKIYKEIGELCSLKNITIGIAESCTGGFIAKVITDIPGISKYFKCSVVSYSNESKIKILNVKKKTLKRYGAVSKETALEMVKGIAHLTGADICVSITGIAGPTGGTKDKPVGTVYISIKERNRIKTSHFIFSGNRNSIRKKTVKKTGELILSTLKKL